MYFVHREFQKIKNGGIYNSRKNTVHHPATNKISFEVISKVKTDIISYEK